MVKSSKSSEVAEFAGSLEVGLRSLAALLSVHSVHSAEAIKSSCLPEELLEDQRRIDSHAVRVLPVKGKFDV